MVVNPECLRDSAN